MFKLSWQVNRLWLKQVKDDIYSARCVACGSVHKITAGVGIIKADEEIPMHRGKVKVIEPEQAKFFAKDSTLISTQGKISLTSEQQKWNAEILRALNVVGRNHSFRSCAADNDLYQCMLPNSKIAKDYSQSKTKVKYVIEFGIAPHIRSLVQADIYERPFTFHFDETTTSQVKKHYDGYVTYYSKSRRGVQCVLWNTLLWRMYS